MSFAKRFSSALLSVSFGSSLVVAPWSAAGAADLPGAGRYDLPGGRTAIVSSGGVTNVFSKDHTKVETRVLPPAPGLRSDAIAAGVGDRDYVMHQLQNEPRRPFEAGRVLVVFRDGISASSDTLDVPAATLLTLRQGVKNRNLSYAQIPRYTNDFASNRVLAELGTDRVERLFRGVSTSTLASMRSSAQAKLGRPLLNIAGAYRLHVSGSSVRDAVARLSKLPGVAYASADWHVTTMNSGPIPLPADAAPRAASIAESLRSGLRTAPLSPRGIRPADVPTNYAVAASDQSFLNAPSVDAVAAYDEINTKLHQMPGQGEIITDLSLGDLDDAGEASNPNDPCSEYVNPQVYGPTTVVIGGQRYLSWPSMPLIPTYTSDTLGNLNPTGSVCGIDPYLGEVGLDFSVMAPLPDALQRAGAHGNGLTDLLGIAPGASYRLVVPASFSPANSDILSALLGAALQTPRPTAITISLGFGEDAYGFPSRYFEDDPLAESLIAAVVQSYDVIVAVSAGDGVRLFTTVAIGPDGGSAPTNVARSGGQITNIDDVAFSTTPSLDYDSGSIDAGGTTLDDIFAHPPQYSSGPLVAQHAYAETRFTGFTSFSSGDGSRVNVSAPSDNIQSFEHLQGGTAEKVDVVLEGGTSASAPEIAAAAAVLHQVGRLTGRPLSVAQIRQLLATTGTPVPPVPQADGVLNVGPQIDLRRAVESQLGAAGQKGTPGVARVAIEQRRNIGGLDADIQTDTDPNDILLQDAATSQWRNETAWITIAPDWEWLPANAQYRLFVTGHPAETIALTPWARALPKTILSAAGLPFVSTSNRTVALTYEALQGPKVLASASFSLTFGPAAATHYGVLAPQVPAVVTGSAIPVTYDLRAIAGQNHPELVVSEPGRMSPATGSLYNPVYTVALTASNGTVDIPVSRLKGGGMYGVDLIYDSVVGRHSDPAFVRVVPASASSARPAAPLLSSNGSTPGHSLTIPYGGSFQVAYDVSTVPGATGALLEVSAAGPGAWGIYNPFNNPGGSVCDNDGVDFGSVYCVPVSGTTGTVTVNGITAGLVPTLNHVVRVIPTKFGVPAGEAGEVSSLAMNGVIASDGGGVQNGFGVGQNGFDGYVTSGQQTAAGTILTSLDTFDQTSNQIVSVVGSSSGSLYFSEGNSGVFGGDIALIGLQNESSGAATYNLLNTVASGTLGSAWTPPAAVDNFVSEAAENSTSDVIPMYYYDPNGKTKDNYRLFTSNIVANTSSPIYDISGPISKEGLPNYWGLAEDVKANQAVLLGEDFFGNCISPTIVTVDLATGAIGSFLGKGKGFPYGIAIDPTRERAAVPTLCDGALTIYDLPTKTANVVPLDGNPSASGNVFNGFYTEVDSKNDRFLVEQTTSPDFGTNNNSLSRVLVYDEAGHLHERKEQFDLYGAFLSIGAHNLQANPLRRNAYLIGPVESQLEPFTY
jgi:hypothetical protein